MYEKILVTLDASPVDEVILTHVEGLAAIHDSTVYLMRVAHYRTRGEKAHEVGQAEGYLDRVRDRLASRGIRVEVALGHGEPTEEIRKRAEELHCDLIAMATHGHGVIGDLVFGSVARDLRHSTNIPLLLIRGTPA